MRSKFQLGLRAKILLPSIVIIGISMSIAILSSYFSSKNALETTITDQLVQLSKSTAEYLDSWVRRTQQDINTLSRQKSVRSFFSATDNREKVRNDINELFKDVADQSGFYELLVMTDNKGDVIASAQKEIIGNINLGDRDYFQKSIAGIPAISDILKSKISGNPVFVVSAPVSNENGVVGVLAGIVDLNYFSRKFMREIKVAGGYAYVFNQKGIIVSHPDEKLVLELDMNTLDFGREMIRMKEGVLEYIFQGVEKIVSFRSLKVINWTLAVTANNETIFAPISGMLWNSLLILFISILVIMIMIIFIVNKILSPISIIEKGIGAAAKGDLKKRIEVKSRDEIGNIATVINSLLGSIQSAIENVIVVMNAVAEGNLSKKVEGNYEGEIKYLQDGIDQSLSLLSKTIIQVASVTEQVGTGANQLSESAQTLARGTSNQAANLEEISSSMNEVSSRSSDNSKNAASARLIAEKSLQAVQMGNEQMKGMNRSMLEIKSTSSEVSKVIKVIEEIAFQTNLLALNAAVEAARAGKYGKGFAVVAEEVRSLASRSAEAAGTTTQLIENSIKEVEKGVRNAEQTSEALENIVEQVEKMNGIIGEIASASNEQTQMIEQINNGISDVNDVVQENSAISEETSASVTDLSRQAFELNEMIKNFTVRE